MSSSLSKGPRSLRHGRPMVATPGPSVIPDRVLAAMAKPMPNLYQGEIVEISEAVMAELPAVARTTGQPFVVIGNGHAAWQMAISNTLSRGDRVLVLESGSFAPRWGEVAAVSGVEFEILPAPSEREPVDVGAVEARLAADTDHVIAAVMVAQTDTATSVRNDVAAIRASMDAAGHPALFLVDCIASMGCDRFEMDAWGVDVAVAACQKGLMVPPGISFVWAGERALAAHKRSDLRVGYLDWERRLNPTAYYELFSGTPPISHLYGLAEALALIAEEGGMEAVWRRHEVMAQAVHAAVDAWAKPGVIEANIIDPSARSNGVTTVLSGSIDVARLAQVCEEQAGLVLGTGISTFAGRGFRIGHMGHLNPPMLLGTLGTIESALHAMQAPLGGSGVAAAAAVIGSALA